MTSVLYVVSVRDSTDIAHSHYAFFHEIQALAVLSAEHFGNESIPEGWDYALKYMPPEKK